jgi:hypothetical protein
VLFAHGRERRLEEGQTNSLVTRIHEIILAHLVRTEQHLANAGTAVSKQSFDPDPPGSGTFGAIKVQCGQFLNSKYLNVLKSCRNHYTRAIRLTQSANQSINAQNMSGKIRNCRFRVHHSCFDTCSRDPPRPSRKKTLYQGYAYRSKNHIPTLLTPY